MALVAYIQAGMGGRGAARTHQERRAITSTGRIGTMQGAGPTPTPGPQDPDVTPPVILTSAVRLVDLNPGDADNNKPTIGLAGAVRQSSAQLWLLSVPIVDRVVMVRRIPSIEFWRGDASIRSAVAKDKAGNTVHTSQMVTERRRKFSLPTVRMTGQPGGGGDITLNTR